MSTTLSAMTAAELVAELAKLSQDKIVKCMNHSCYHPNSPHLLGEFCEKCGSGLSKRWCYEQLANPKLISELTAELDARCETFEISLFERAGMVQFKYGQFMQKEGIGAWLNISATEQHALESYLLTKGGDLFNSVS